MGTGFRKGLGRGLRSPDEAVVPLSGAPASKLLACALAPRGGSCFGLRMTLAVQLLTCFAFAA
jgi:hypothetical protein